MKSKIISSSPKVMVGTPVFAGTRVPIKILLDYIEKGESIDIFLEGYPSVAKEQVLSFLTNNTIISKTNKIDHQQGNEICLGFKS